MAGTDTSQISPYTASCGGGLVLNKDVYNMQPGEALRSDPQHAQLADRDYQRKLKLLKTDYGTHADYMRTDVIGESIATNIGGRVIA